MKHEPDINKTRIVKSSEDVCTPNTKTLSDNCEQKVSDNCENDAFHYIHVNGLGCGFLTPISTLSVITWCSDVLVKETGVPGACHWQTESYQVVSSTSQNRVGSELKPC